MAVVKSNFVLLKSLLIGVVLVGLYLLYQVTLGTNVKISADTYYFFVSERYTPKMVADTLKKRGFLKSRWSLRIMASLKGLEEIEAGMYEVKKGWSNAELIEHFRQYHPKPTIFITVPSLQSRNSLIRAVCRGTAISPEAIWKLIKDKKFTKELGALNEESIFSIFIPRSYRIYKKCTAKELLERFYQEYLLFWNEERMRLADDMRLKPSQVCTLSSIVYSETKSKEEMPIIAGVYLNRIRINMRLESDPTLLYASRKFGSKRVLFRDKNVSSPYNTYKNKGLPPGPIYTVPSWVIDKVLEYEGHDYLYFCANHDFSGEHLFAETFEEHKENAKRYREKLDKENIY